MLTCSKCHRFIKLETVDIIVQGYDVVGPLIKVEGDCSKCGRVDVDYDDMEELGIDY